MDYTEIIKTAIIYFVMIVILRILGKREVGELSIFDLVILLLIANIASLGLDNDDFFYTSIACLVTLMILQKLISFLLLKISYFRGIIEGNPVTIIFDGKLKVKNMKKENYTIDDLLSQLREQNINSISDIYLAVLETNGKLSIFKDKTRISIIYSGKFDLENLSLINLNKSYIINEFAKNEINYKKILFASVYDNELFFYYKNKKLKDIEEKRIELT